MPITAPRDACCERPRPRPPQDQVVFRGRGSDANRIDCDGPIPDASAPVSPTPVSAPVPALVEDAAPTRTGSIAMAHPEAPAPVSPPPDSGPGPATPEPEPPRRMTASQEASLDAWLIKTYLACWKPAAQPCRHRSLRRAGAPQIQTQRIAPEAAEARQSAVRSGAEAAGKERVAGGQGMRPFADAGSISLLL